jgi:hypothetical protein
MYDFLTGFTVVDPLSQNTSPAVGQFCVVSYSNPNFQKTAGENRLVLAQFESMCTNLVWALLCFQCCP